MKRTYVITIEANNMEDAHEELTGAMQGAIDSGIIESFDIDEMEGD